LFTLFKCANRQNIIVIRVTTKRLKVLMCMRLCVVHYSISNRKAEGANEMVLEKVFDILSSLRWRFLDTRALERGSSQIYNDFTIFSSEVSMLVSS
jgi:hypothetical protein